MRFPPRTELPSGITIEKVPMLGTTWYDRGVSYWLRRIGMIVMMALVIALVTEGLVGLFGAIRETSLTGFYVALVVEITYSLVIIVFFAVRLARRWNNMGEAQRSVPTRAAGSAGAVLGTLAQSGFFVGQLLLVVGSLLFFGLYVAVFLAMFLPEIFWERPARCRLAERLRSRGYDFSVS